MSRLAQQTSRVSHAMHSVVGARRPGSPVPASAPTHYAAKRVFDVAIAVAVLLAWAPLLPWIAVLIRLDSKGPVFYSQIRVGHNRRRSGGAARDDRRERRRVAGHGRPFRILKFRTMYVASESDRPQWARPNDPRITRVGRVLRRTRLDEVPQVWNVLRGEMSIVGPRPERPWFVQHLSRDVPGYVRRLEVKPGITGLAQVTNGYDQDRASVERKVALDLRYIRESSPWLDTKILLRSIPVMLTGRGAC